MKDGDWLVVREEMFKRKWVNREFAKTGGFESRLERVKSDTEPY
jgi:hypothetical protein